MLNRTYDALYARYGAEYDFFVTLLSMTCDIENDYVVMLSMPLLQC